ncbi:MAG: LysR family transcriptional regulator [Polyangiales bacterium]
MNGISLPDPALDVRDLRLVLALAEAGTTAQAASLLHLTQPAVSRALLAAEGKLGVTLFERSPRGLAPTTAGERLLGEARAILLALGDLEARVCAKTVRRARLRLVCECYTAYHWLPSALVGLRAALPGLEVRLAVEHTADPVAALEAGDVDVALLTRGVVRDARVAERPLFADEVVFLVAAKHALAARSALTRADLRANTLITSEAPLSEQRWFMRSVFGQARPRLTFERLPLTEAVIDLTRAGHGIGVLSHWVATPHLAAGDLRVLRLKGGALERGWRIAYRQEAADAAARLHTALAASAPRLLPRAI